MKEYLIVFVCLEVKVVPVGEYSLQELNDLSVVSIYKVYVIDEHYQLIPIH